MRVALSAAVVAAGLSLIIAGPASATEGAAGSGIAAAVQYQPENTGSVPVTPPPTTPDTPVTPTEASSTPPTATTSTTTPAAAPSTPAPTPKQHSTPSTPKSAPKDVPVAQTTPNAEPVAAPSTASSLPFTGYDLVPVAIIGLALLGLGAFMRRHSRRDHG